MIDEGGQAVRGLRALALLALSVGLGTLAHDAATHTGVDAAALILLALILTGPTLWVTRRQVRASSAAGLLLVAQALVHVTATATAPVSATVIVHAHAHAMPTAGGEQVGAVSHLPSAAMMLAHLVAAAIVGVLYARGEAALWAVVRAIQPPSAPALAVPTGRSNVTTPPAPSVPGDRYGVVAARGPPSAPAALAA